MLRVGRGFGMVIRDRCGRGRRRMMRLGGCRIWDVPVVVVLVIGLASDTEHETHP